MENEKYLSEERYQETNKKVSNTSKILLTIGIILLVVGVIITITGFVNFNKVQNNAIDSFNNSASNMFDSFNSSIDSDYDGSEFVDSMKDTFTSTANSSKNSFNSIMLIGFGSFISTAGIVLIIAGGVMTYMAHRREITAYTTQQTMPIKQETINNITPNVAESAGTIAKSISQGIEEGKQSTEDNQNKVN